MFGFLKKGLIARRDRMVEEVLIAMINNNVSQYDCKNIFWESFVGYCCSKSGEDPRTRYQDDFICVDFNYRGVEYNASFMNITHPKQLKCVSITIDTSENLQEEARIQLEKLFGLK